MAYRRKIEIIVSLSSVEQESFTIIMWNHKWKSFLSNENK